MRKRYLRRTLAMILSMLMIIGTVPTSVFAEGTSENAEIGEGTEEVQAEKSVSDETENLENEVGDGVTEDNEKEQAKEILEEEEQTASNENSQQEIEALIEEQELNLAVNASSNGVSDAIQKLVNVYPNSCSYFTSDGKVDSSNSNSRCSLANIPSRGDLPSGKTVKNAYGKDAWSCHSFAEYVWYVIFGHCTNTQTQTISASQLQLGDFIRFSGHSAIYLGQDSKYYYVYDSNWASPADNKVRYNHTISKSRGIEACYHATNYNDVAKPVEVSNNPIGAVESASGGVYSVSASGWAFDVDELSTALKIHVYIGNTIIGTTVANLSRADVNNAYGCGENHGYSFSFDVGKEFVGKQTVRVYAINVGGGTNAFLGEKEVIIDSDTSAPEISDCKITDITSSGYTVSCKVTDNTGVDRVQFPSWTSYKGQDDITEAWQTNSLVSGQKNGDVYTYEVKTSDHNYELGAYNTHIYAYDRYGNASFKQLDEIIVPELPKTTLELGDDFYATVQNICTGTVLTQVEKENKLEAYFCGNNNSRAQIWHFKKNNNSDTYTIFPEENEAMVLEVAGGFDEEKANVQLWTPNGSKAQRWKILKDNGRYCLQPESSDIRVLDTPNGSKDDVNAQIYSYNEGTGTGFEIIKVNDKGSELKKEKELIVASYNGHSYQVFEQGMSWSDAKRACEKLGGHLLTITSEKEQKFIEHILKNNNASMNQYWLGMYRYQDEYSWITNESNEYTNWNNGEPNGITSNQSKEYCVQMINKVQDESRFKWNDINNFNTPLEGSSDFYRTESIGVICEFESLKEFTLSYDANGGSQAPEQEKKEQETEVTISTKKPKREGYTFLGWAKKANAEKAEYQSGDKYVLDEDTTLYAVWEKAITGTCGEKLTWSLSQDGTLTISGTGPMTNYTYKSQMPWYQYINQIKNIVIKEGVTSIGDYAFYGISNLTKVTIPKGITAVGEYAFKNCTALNDIQLPTTLKKLGESAFFGCSALREISIPEGLYTIWGYTFKNCTKLEKITFPSTLIKIDEAAFYGCTSLKTLTIPDNVTIIGSYCFKNCTNLSSVQLSNGIQQIREAAFYGTALTELVVPDKVTDIKAYAFKNCTALKSITFSKSLKQIGDSAFYACSDLTELNLPDTVTDIKDYAFRKCTGLKNVKFSSGLKTVGESSFYGCENLTELKLPEGITDIKGYAFKGCIGATTITLPSTLKTMGESAFYGCIGITKIEIPKNVTNVGDYAFSRCSKLNQVTFKGGAPTIGTNAFAKVTATVNYPSGNTTWSKDKQNNYGGTLTWSETK